MAQWSGAKALCGFSAKLILGTSCLLPAVNARHCLQVQDQMPEAIASSSSGYRRGAGGTWLGAPLTQGGQLLGPCLQGMLDQMKPQNSGRECLTWQVCRPCCHQGNIINFTPLPMPTAVPHWHSIADLICLTFALQVAPVCMTILHTSMQPQVADLAALNLAQR